MKQNSWFITLEGIEGAGKSTHIEFIKDFFIKHSFEVLHTREPGGTKLGEAIRNTLLSTDFQNDISDDAELLLMFAARAQHINEVIKPALEQGKVVLCDRFTDSSFAYQGGGRGIATEKIQRLKQWVHSDLNPDITLLFDLPVEIGLERAGKRGAADRFESEQLDFFKKVRNQYLQLAKQEPERFHLIDAEKSIDDIQSNLQRLLQNRCL